MKIKVVCENCEIENNRIQRGNIAKCPLCKVQHKISYKDNAGGCIYIQCHNCIGFMLISNPEIFI